MNGKNITELHKLNQIIDALIKYRREK